MIRLSALAVVAALGSHACVHAGSSVVPADAVVAAEPAPAWRAVNAETGTIRDLEGLAALAEAFPDSSSVRLRLLNAQLQAADWPALIDTLSWLNARGYVFSEGARNQIPKLVGEDFVEQAAALLLEPSDPIERSEIAWTVPAEAGLVESVYVYEPKNRVAVTSITTRSAWAKPGNDDWEVVVLEGADNLTGIAGFTASREVWVASGNVDGSEDEEAYFSGLYGPEDRFAAPEGAILSDIHAAPDRTIFASDPINGGVYKLGPLREAIETLIAPGTFRSPQGLAASSDGKRLYVSDYRYGIGIVDLAAGKITRLASDVPVILDGTDALFRRGNSLIAIQNGTSPMRISQFLLSDDGMRVVDHRILEQAHSGWTEPLSGHLSEDALYYIGNGQWDKYVAGELGQGKQPDPTQIRRLSLE